MKSALAAAAGLAVVFASPLATAGPAVFGEGAGPSGPGIDKRGYHLFNPVPMDQLREMVGDRPDGTENPTTVDPGRVQVETSFFEWSRDWQGGERSEEFVYGAMNFRFGLLHDLELQVIFDLYTRAETRGGGVLLDRTEGFSDVMLRPKWNLWGNEGGETALALMPTVKIPTSRGVSNGEVEGGIAVPFAIDPGGAFDLGFMAEVLWLHDEDRGRHEPEFLHTAVVGCELSERVGTYLEYIGIAGPGSYRPHLSSGLTFGLNENTVLDLGVIVGLNEAAEDLRLFSGITVRF